MRSLLLDAGYVVALEVDNDQHHATAVEHWRETMSGEPVKLVTTAYVFNEVVTFLNRRRQHARAVEVGNRLLLSQLIEFIEVDSSIWGQGWDYFQRHADKTYSLTDCISFVVMNQLGIRTALTFDHHFRQAGFDVEPILPSP